MVMRKTKKHDGIKKYGNQATPAWKRFQPKSATTRNVFLDYVFVWLRTKLLKKRVSSIKRFLQEMLFEFSKNFNF